MILSLPELDRVFIPDGIWHSILIVKWFTLTMFELLILSHADYLKLYFVRHIILTSRPTKRPTKRISESCTFILN